jgi:hypothetical protein
MRFVHNAAIRHAATKRHLDAFALLLPHQIEMTIAEKYVLGTRLNGGIAAVDQYLGDEADGEEGTSLTHGPESWSHFGLEAIKEAIHFLCEENVKLVLDRGIRLLEAVEVYQSTVDEHGPLALEKINKLIEKHEMSTVVV